MSSPRKTRSRSRRDGAAAAAVIVEAVAVASPILEMAVEHPSTPENKSRRLARAVNLIEEGGASVRAASKECGISRQLIKVLVSCAFICLQFRLICN